MHEVGALRITASDIISAIDLDSIQDERSFVQVFKDALAKANAFADQIDPKQP